MLLYIFGEQLVLFSVNGSFKLLTGVFWSCYLFPIPFVCFHHLHLLADKNSSFDICGFLFFSYILKLSKVTIYCTDPFFQNCSYFRRCLDIFITSTSVYPVSGQNGQEGICPPKDKSSLVNQFSIYNFPRRTTL